MKVLKNKTISKKIIILLLCILLLSFFIPKSVKADDGIGGKLLNPILSLFVGLGDGAMSLLEKIVLQKDVSLINIDTSASFWSKVIVAVASLAVMAITVATVVFTGGGSGIAIALGIAKTIITVGSAAVITFPITTTIVEGMFPDSFYLPLYSITPQEIFSNDVLLLDVDFFNPKENEKIQKAVKVESVEVKVIDKKMQELKDKYGFTSLENTEKETRTVNFNLETYYRWNYNGRIYQLNYFNASNGWSCFSWDPDNPSDQEYIFGGDGAYVLDKDTEVENKIKYVESGEIQSTARALRSTIANWYNILRDIALVALLSVLVYIGIRILISSTSSDKAKYKQMIVDWIVAICLLFIMQYIMSFSNLFVNKFISLIDSTKITEGKTTETTEPEVFVLTDKDKVKKAYKALVKDPVKDEKLSSEKDSPYYVYFLDNDDKTAGEKSTKLVWPAENFMQQVRIKLQLLDSDKNETYVSIGWKLIYVVLVLFTFIFLFTYIKRVVYMAFLTLIAPLVALTYPIDKMNDGQAQAFNAWFKEYIFNLIIQPMHLILYTILISSAMDFASENILYVIVALGFMVPAEKLLRKFFGFNKADTPGILAGPAGAALMMNGMNKLLGKGPKGGKPPVSKNGKNVDSLADEKPPRINNDFDKDKALFGDGLDGISTSTNKNNVNDTTNTNNSLLQGENKLLDDEADLMKNSLGTGNKLSEPLKNNKIGVNGNNINSKNIQAQNPKRSIKRAIGMAGRYYVNKKAKGIANKMQNGHYIRTVAKLGAGVVGATAAGAAGLALGVTSGDPSKAAQYIATGALGGYRVGSGIPDKFDTSGMNDLKEVAKLGYYGSDEEYNYVQQQKYIKDYQNNDKNMLELEQKYGNEEAKRIMKEDIPTLLNNGVTDIKDIAAIEDMIKDNKISVNSVDEGIAVKKYASRIGEDSTKMTAKKREEWQKTFANEFGNKEKYKGHDHLKMANSVLNKVDEFNKTKK